MPDLTAELVVDRLIPRDAAISPDGSTVVLRAGPGGQPEEFPSGSLWLAAADGRQAPRRLTSGAWDDRCPTWSRDGSAILFLSDRAGRSTRMDLFRLPLDGGEPEHLVDRDATATNILSLPQADDLVLIVPDAKTPEDVRRERERDDAEVFGERWKPARLHVVDPASGDVRTIEDLGDRHVAHAAVSPDGAAIAVVTWPTPEIDNSLRQADLRIVDLSSGSVRLLMPLPNGASGLTWHPDGGRLLWLAHRRPDWRGSLSLFAAPIDGGPATCLGDDLDGCLLEIVAGTSGSPMALVAKGLDTAICRLGQDDRLEPMRTLQGDAYQLSVSADGERLAWIWSAPDRPDDVWTGAMVNDPVQVTHFCPGLDGLEWGRQERLAWTAPDGLAIEGLLILPPGKDRRNGPFPLVTQVHGGPYHRWTDRHQLEWDAWGQWLAHAGYAVLLPNPRGGSGRGDDFADTVAGRVGREDWEDIQAGIDRLVADGVADPDRLAIGGWSQGGFMTAWAVGQTDRFRCGIMGAGVSDWGMMVAESDLPHFEAMLGGSTGWEGPGPHPHDAVSPVSFVHRMRTPLLVLHGDRDERVPASQGRFMARGLRDHGVPFELVTYPREPHAIRERNHQLDLLLRVRAWLARWMPAS